MSPCIFFFVPSCEIGGETLANVGQPFLAVVGSQRRLRPTAKMAVLRSHGATANASVSPPKISHEGTKTRSLQNEFYIKKSS
jgi:hypothetical protein